MSRDSYIMGFLHPRVLMPRGSYIYRGSYNQGFLHLGLINLGVLMFTSSNVQGFLGPRIHTPRVLKFRGSYIKVS